MAALKLARYVDVNPERGTLVIDGVPFGYYLSDEPVHVVIEHGVPHKVTVTILTEHVTITDKG